MNPHEMPFVELCNVTRLYGGLAQRTIGVRNVSLSAGPGELVLLLGPSGSGKTTLLTLIAGLIQPTAGTVTLFGEDITRFTTESLQDLRTQRIGFVFQTFYLIDSLTVVQNIELVLGFAGKSRSEATKRAREMCAQMDIAHLARRLPPTLSQGEKQRVAIARAFANNPDLIIADEPTASLESAQGFEIVQRLRTHAKNRHRCVIVASHDQRIITLADHILHLKDGELRSEDKKADPVLV